MSLPEIIAHRGASHAAPENTLSAVRLAQAEGDRSLSKNLSKNYTVILGLGRMV